MSDFLGTNRDFSTYKESVSSFLITEDGKKLVVISKDYHYIFDLDNKLKNILLSKNKKQLTPDFDYINVSVDNSISVQYKLYSNDNNIKWLKKSGFYPSDNKKWSYMLSAKIKGIRYKAKENLPAKYQFNKAYSMTIFVDDSSSVKAQKAILTPVAITADMTVVVAGIAAVMTYSLVTGTKICPSGC